jgi:hypothetical protein
VPAAAAAALMASVISTIFLETLVRYFVCIVKQFGLITRNDRRLITDGGVVQCNDPLVMLGLVVEYNYSSKGNQLIL